jgi:glyoxylase-like metal-dependent hydrolase (beta-lactamase superfamily II)
MSEHTRQLDYEIVQVDTGYMRNGLAACYLVVDDGAVAVIDTGVALSVDRIGAALTDLGLSFRDVTHVVPTHVHLDHAGGAGKLMQVCPEASMVIHPFGSRHMIDPAKLIAGAEAVYGREELLRNVGKIVPVAAERVIDAADMFRFHVGKRELLVLDTPGHARHHFCIWDEKSSGIFSGDTLGVAYAELACDGREFIFPPTTPVQFDPVAWHESIDRLMALRPEIAYLTHFGMLEEPVLYMNDLHRRIDDLAELALGCSETPDRLAGRVSEYFHQELGRSGCPYDYNAANDVLAMDIDIIVQGLRVWLQRRKTRH